MENEIIILLSSVEGDILDNEKLVAQLNSLRDTAEDITQRIKTSEATERRLNAAREIYTPVAVRATSLYFSITDVAKIQPIYQFSLNWFILNCIHVLRQPSPIRDELTRVKRLIDEITQFNFSAVCSSLFERD